MNTGLTVEFRVHFTNGAKGQKRLRDGPPPPSVAIECGRVPRISKLMALAIRFEKLVQTGAVQDYAELARLGHVTRARLSQIMDLLQLAPDIQEEILFLPQTTHGDNSIAERNVRGIVAVADWKKQRRLWTELKTANCA